MTQATKHHYIVKDSRILNGEPVIKGTHTRVPVIVENWRLGILPAEIPQHLPHLTLAQVFDALSYYLNRQTEINGYIAPSRIPDQLINPLGKTL